MNLLGVLFVKVALMVSKKCPVVQVNEKLFLESMETTEKQALP